MNKLSNSRGQSVIEVVFLIGALALVLAGAVALMVNSLSSRTRGFDRKKAAELAEYVIEGYVNVKTNTPETFWQETQTNLSDQNLSQYPGYSYDVGFSNVTSQYACSSQCVEARITVKWQRDASQSVLFTRLFAK